MSLSTGDIQDDIKRLLLAGLQEAAGGAKEELTAFADEVSAEIAEIAVRAAMGIEPAVIALSMLKQQALTKTHRSFLKAQGVGEKQASLIFGMIGRVMLGAL